MRRMIYSVIIILLLIPVQIDKLTACTSAIITGKATPDGRSLLWKHRDTGELDNRIEYFGKSKEIKYAFIALVNSSVQYGEAWTGTNESGFSIMNTASYNLKEDDDKLADREGEIMFQALATCRTLTDFEKMLNKAKRPIGVEANFGVIDAEGGAAYYEVNNTEWRKVDVNDPKIAPQGYLVYTNHSFTGRINEGSGYVRFTAANRIFSDRLAVNGEFTPQWIFNSLSRCYYNPILNIDLIANPELAPNGWYVDQDFIPRRISSASIVVKGVKKGENPDLTVMWTILGYAPVSVAVPLFVKGGENLPKSVVKRGENDQNLEADNCLMCDLSMQRKANIFPIKRGNGRYYFHFSLIYNREQTGYMQRLAPYENKIFVDTDKQMNKWYSDGSVDLQELNNLYHNLDFGEDIR